MMPFGLGQSSSFASYVFFVSSIALGFCIIAIFTWDQPIALWMMQPELQGFRHFSRQVTDVALGDSYFVLSLATYFLAAWILPRIAVLQPWSAFLIKLRFSAGFAFLTLLVVGLTNLFFKALFGRARPHLTDQFESTHFDPFNTHWHWHSFPSGHSQVIFTVATLLALAFPKARYILLFAAASIAFTRIPIHQHFFSDVIFGATIGHIGTLCMFWFFARPRLCRG